MRKMFGKRAAILALAVMMVMPQCSFAFAQDSTDAEVANDNSSEIIEKIKPAAHKEHNTVRSQSVDQFTG